MIVADQSIELIGETSNCRGYGFLNDLIIKGTIKGIAAVIGCSSAKTFHQSRHVNLVRELIKDNILVITTGCASISCGTNSLLDPDNAIEFSGPGLTKLYQQISIPPVLACGSCVDNSRLLMMACEIVKAGRLGDDLSQLPLAGACLESMHEKSFSIGQYFVASGILTVFAEDMFPFLGSENICNYLTSDIEHIFGGRWAFESNPVKAAKLIKDHIMKQRNTLGLEMDNKKILPNYLKIE